LEQRAEHPLSGAAGAELAQRRGQRSQTGLASGQAHDVEDAGFRRVADVAGRVGGSVECGGEQRRGLTADGLSMWVCRISRELDSGQDRPEPDDDASGERPVGSGAQRRSGVIRAPRGGNGGGDAESGK
jgi:hypothetical protein